MWIDRFVFWNQFLNKNSIYTVIPEFYDKFRRFYEYIYLYIYDSCRLRLSCKWASYPLAFPVKTYTLVYFSSKASLLMIKSHNKYQSIDLIGLVLVEKAYSKNRSFLSHNRSYWRELRPLVTPWTWCIKEGTEPWRGQIGFSCLMSMVSLLPLSLSPLLLLLCYGFVVLLLLFTMVMYMWRVITVTGINVQVSLSLSSMALYAFRLSEPYICQLGLLHYVCSGSLSRTYQQLRPSLSLLNGFICIQALWTIYMPA